MKIELSDDTISNMVLQDLKGSYDLCREFDDDVRMRALQTVLEYYMVPSEFKEWYENQNQEVVSEATEGSVQEEVGQG